MMMPSDNFPRPQLQLGQHHQNVQSQPFLLPLFLSSFPLPLLSPSPLSLPLPPPSNVQTRQAMPRLFLVYSRSSRYTHDKTDTTPRGKKTLGGTSHYEVHVSMPEAVLLLQVRSGKDSGFSRFYIDLGTCSRGCDARLYYTITLIRLPPNCSSSSTRIQAASTLLYPPIDLSIIVRFYYFADR